MSTCAGLGFRIRSQRPHPGIGSSGSDRTTAKLHQVSSGEIGDKAATPSLRAPLGPLCLKPQDLVVLLKLSIYGESRPSYDPFGLFDASHERGTSGAYSEE